MDLLAEQAVRTKLGPTSGPTDKLFLRFAKWWDSLTDDDFAKLEAEAANRAKILNAEDEVTREMREMTTEFLREFQENEATASFQRGDYREYALLVQV